MLLLLLKAMKWNIFGVRSARFWLLPGAVAFPQVSFASNAWEYRKMQRSLSKFRRFSS